MTEASEIGREPRKLGATRDRLSISSILARLVIGIMLPLLAFSALLLWRYTETQRQRTEHEAAASALRLARDVDRDIRGIIAALSGLASSPALGNTPGEEFYIQAKQVGELIGAPILLRDAASGRQLLNTRIPFGTPIQADKPLPYVAEVANARKPVVTDLFFGPIAKKQLIGVAVPVFSNGDVRAVLVASIEPERLATILADQTLEDTWSCMIIDRTGLVIARSNELQASVGRRSTLVGVKADRGFERDIDMNGVPVLRGYARTAAGWVVATMAPLAAVDRPVLDTWLLFLTVGASAMCIALPVTLHQAARIAGSLRNLATAASGLERGEAVAPIATDVEEAALVSDILSTASASLRERTRLLAESAARFRSAFDQAAVGFEQTALDGSWLALNNRLCNFVGYTRTEILDLNAKQLTVPEDYETEQAQLQKLLTGEQTSASLEKRYIRKDGTIIWVRATTSLVRDIAGAPLYFVSVVEDITAGHEARATNARLAALVRASNDAIISLTKSGMIETWNPGATELFGHDERSALGQAYTMLVSKAKIVEAQQIFERALRGEAFRVEAEAVHKDGTPIDVAISVSPIGGDDGGIKALSITIEDIRERRKWEQQLKLLNRELQHRVKNSLAVVQSIANQTSRLSRSPSEFREAFQGRLQALAAANDLLLQTSWAGTTLSTIIDQQLSGLITDPKSQLSSSGPDVVLPQDLTVPLGLALHELGTNALKHGALAVPDGHVSITWSILLEHDRQELLINWSETGITLPPTPPRQGFGRTLIQRGIPRAIVEHDLTPGGLICTIRLPLPTAQTGSHAAPNSGLKSNLSAAVSIV